MNIQNIQIAQDLFRTVEEKLSSRKANISEQRDASTPQVNVPDAQDKTVDNPKVWSEEDLMTVVYPPFFPIGNTQDILSIEGVKQLTGENVKSKSSQSSTDAAKEQKATQHHEINNKAANPDASAVKDKPQAEHDTNPGVVLDFKV